MNARYSKTGWFWKMMAMVSLSLVLSSASWAVEAPSAATRPATVSRTGTSHMERISADVASLVNYLWNYVGGLPLQNAWRTLKGKPFVAEVSARISQDLQKYGRGGVQSRLRAVLAQVLAVIPDPLSPAGSGDAEKKISVGKDCGKKEAPQALCP